MERIRLIFFKVIGCYLMFAAFKKFLRAGLIGKVINVFLFALGHDCVIMAENCYQETMSILQRPGETALSMSWQMFKNILANPPQGEITDREAQNLFYKQRVEKAMHNCILFSFCDGTFSNKGFPGMLNYSVIRLLMFSGLIRLDLP